MISRSDMRYTLRLLSKSPGFSLLSILVMAGGLGVSILAFTFNYTMFYKPIPLENGAFIYHICAGPEPSGCRPMKAFEFSEIRAEISHLENIGVYHNNPVVMDIAGVPVTVNATSTEWNMFQLSGTRPIHGRSLLPADEEAAAEPVILLGYEFWQQQFNGDQEVVGRVFDVNGEATRIIGVMPEGYMFPWRAPAWLPIAPEIKAPAVNGPVAVETYGLLKPASSPAAASAEVAGLMQGIRARYPVIEPPTQLCRASVSLDCDTGHIAEFPLAEFGGGVALAMIVLTGMLTGFIFLLAAISVGTLLLARTNERLRDTSIRVALGAPRRRLLVQMMGESIVIAVVGAVLGILLAATMMNLVNILFQSVDEQAMAFWQVFRVDSSTIVGALVMVLITVVLTSALPSWRIINGDFNAVMRDGTRGALGLKPGRFNRGLVVIAVTIITLLSFLVATAGTYAFRARDTFGNMNSAGLLVAQPRLDGERYSVNQAQDFYRGLDSRLLASPNVDSVYYTTSLGSVGIEPEGDTGPANELLMADVSSVAGSLATSGISLLEGRLLYPFEASNTSPVVLLSQSLASQLWPGRSALGERIRINSDRTEDGSPWREVVGVVTDRITTTQLISNNQNAAYLPFGQTEMGYIGVVAKASNNSAVGMRQASADVSGAILALAPELLSVRVFDLQGQSDSLSSAVTLAINLSGATALFAFLVAVGGIFGLTQNVVLSSTQEIGTRRALGASDRSVRRTFLFRGGKQAFLGFALAMIVILPVIWLSLATVGMEVVGVTIAPVLGAMLLLYGAIVFAIYQPIRSVLRLEPIAALRYE